MKKIFIAGLIAISIQWAGKVFAQQEAMYTQYMFNTLAINPGYAGSRNVLSATALVRTQWSGMDGAPGTTTFTIDAPFNKKKMGLGLQLFKDKIGITSHTGAVATYAYRIRMSKGSLAFGMQGGVTQYKATYSSLKLDPYGNSDDPAFKNDAGANFFSLGSGVYYTSDNFYLGLSSPQLLQNKLPGSSTTEQSGQNKQFSHLFFMTGCVLSLSDDFKLKPSILLKAVQGAPLEGDINANLWIKGIFSVGAQYRTKADVSGMLELQVTPLIRVGYAYDYSLTDLKSYNNGSHEIMLRYELGLDRDRVLSPRYF